MRRATAIKPKADDVEFFHDIEQRDPEWHALRRGIPTASKFSVIMASGADGEDSKTRAKLMNVMAGEILTGETAETFRNEAMDRGVEMEPEARAYYERATFSALTKVGFVRRTIHNPIHGPLIVGASPDSLVDDDGILEIKTTRPDLLIPILKKGAAGLPAIHKAQCHGTMWVTGRAWCDLLIYYRGMPKARFRIERDDVYIAKIRNAVEVFAFELATLVRELRTMDH
jgi:putative phage-type endonuclease